MLMPHHFISVKNGDLQPLLLMEDLDSQKKLSSIWASIGSVPSQRNASVVNVRKALGTSGLDRIGARRSTSNQGYPVGSLEQGRKSELDGFWYTVLESNP
ncbi:hypothetical protein ACOSP7_009913 [Xanthoceras sorbifolium]